MISNINTVAVYVTDQQRALAFYTQKLGFQVRFRASMGPEADWIELVAPGAQTALVIYPRSLMEDWSERKPSIVFRCEDVEKTYQELSDKGVQFMGEPQKMVWGVYAQFTDEDENQFLLMSPVEGVSA